MESGLRARHHHRHHPPPPPPGREDCWSEGATGALIEAWGDRYLQLSRGNLRQKDWTDVAGAVNARQEELRKPRKTDVQCKNRVDTIKKKYKLEKSRPGPSLWPFFSRLDLLVGPGSTPNPALKKHRPPPTLANSRHPNPSSHRRPSVSSTVKHRNPHPSPNAAVHSGGSSSRSLVNSPLSTESSREETGGRDDYDEGNNVDEEDDNEDDLNNGLFDAVDAGKKQRRWGSFVGGGSGGGGGSRAEGAFGELAKAILMVADTYERVESSKQQQMMELERQRMEFAKDLEFQRMQMFMEAQLELEKLKRPKYESGSGKRL